MWYNRNTSDFYWMSIRRNQCTRSKDFFSKKTDPITEIQNAFYVQDHFMVNGIEYKFGVPIPFIGGEWSAHRNWEWARMEIVQVGTVDLKELHGTWNYSMF